VLTQARRFEELKVDHQVKEMPQLDAIETGVRPLAKLSPSDTPQIRVVGGDEA
jgi:DNA recombination protein RmuC